MKAVDLLCVVMGKEENEKERRAISRCGGVVYDRCGGGLARTRGWRGASYLFLLGKAGHYVYLLSLLRACFHVFEIGRAPSINNIRSFSTMATADSAVCIFYLGD